MTQEQKFLTLVAMKQRHRVYATEEELLTAIDRATERLQHHRERCTELDTLMAECRRVIAKAKRESARQSASVSLIEYETESARLIKQARSIEDTTLPKLKHALAAFRTRTFDFMGDYQGMVAA